MRQNLLNNRSVKFPSNMLRTVALGGFGGFGLGVIARFWMRWISTDPEFTWPGTLGIVLGFTFFGVAHSLLYFFKMRASSMRRIAIFRIVAILFTVPLFGAAGAIMFPTVLLGSLALWRNAWFRSLRVLLGLLSLGWAAKVAYIFMIQEFGWSIRSIAQILVFASIYSVIIVITKLTVERARPKRG